jgi:SAM-dependent methyltransferase
VGGLPYDPAYIAGFYDDYGEREWDRFERTPMDRVNLEVHRRLLHEFVRPGERALEAGAGPGRFTLELAALGARVVVGDISPRQLELHRERTTAIEEAIEDRLVLDIVDLSRFDDGSFDAVVCYGGPLSYVLGEADRALGELLRVTRPGGRLLLTVMSLLGAARAYFDSFPELIAEFGWERAVADVFLTGDLPADINRGHVCRLYRWSELRALLDRHPCELLAASASNFLSVEWEEEPDPRFLDYELAACREPGALDAGTHIVAVVERTGGGADRSPPRGPS